MVTDLPQKALAELTLTDLNNCLPSGWHSTLLDLSKKGEFEPTLIQACGLDVKTFYRLKRECAAFEKVLSECALWRITFWHGIQKAMIFGDVAPATQRLLIRILEKLENDFDRMASHGDAVATNAQKALLAKIPTAELLRYVTHLFDDAELAAYAAEGDFDDAEPPKPAKSFDATDAEFVESNGGVPLESVESAATESPPEPELTFAEKLARANRPRF